MIWFSSDFHFGHTNIAGKAVSRWTKGYRDFESVHEMNKTITKAVNDCVKQGDTLYFIGDFAFGGHENIPAYRHSLVCQTIYLLRGNHDKHIDKYSSLFAGIYDVLSLSYPTMNFFLSHYSHRVWPGSHKGTVHLYGHSHNTIPSHGKSMDVGIDTAYEMYGQYRPFSIDEIMSIMSKRDITFSDGHRPTDKE